MATLNLNNLVSIRRGGVIHTLLRVMRGGVQVWPPSGGSVAPANTAPPVVSGATTPGSTLTSTGGTFTGSPTPVASTRWQVSTDSGTTWAVAATSTNALTFVIPAGATAGMQYRSQRQATNSAGTTAWISSNVITVTTAAAVAPARTTASTLSSNGTGVGSVITAAGSVWTGTEPISFSRGWQRRLIGGSTWANIPGFDPSTSIGATFTIRADDQGYDIRMTERGINSAGSTGNLTSANFVTIPAAAATAPAVTTAAGMSPASGPVGTVFTITPAAFSGSPTPAVTRTLTQNGVDVTSQISGNQFTSTAAGPLVLTYTATNSAGNMSSSVTRTVTAATGPIAGTLTNPPMSARLGIINERSARPFINAFKQAWEWEGNRDGGNWAALRAAGHITDGGQVVSIPGGEDAGIRTRVLDSMVAESGATGRWRLTWTGTGTLDVSGGSNVTRPNANTAEFDYTANGASWVNVIVRSVASGQLANFKLVHQNDWDADASGAIFRQQYLNEVRNYRCLRFDEWTGILRDEPYGLAVTTWASRPLPTDETFMHRFVPLEWQIQLCNLAGADFWPCMPTAATADYDTGAATLTRDSLSSALHAYPEYSTKTWDFAGTPQAHYCAEQGRIAFGTTANPTEQEFRSWYGMRSTLMAQRWKAVWTGANAARLHTVIQHQADWVGGEYDVLVAPMWQERNGTLGLPPYVAPHSVCDVLTVHAQIDGGMAYGSAASLIETWRTTLTQTEAFNRMRDQLLTGPYHNTGDTGRRTVQLLTPKWQHYRTVADNYGMELASYEVGNHLNGVGGSAAMQAFVHAFSVSAQMGEVYAATIDAIRDAGFDGPLAFAVECRYPDSNICHGLQRWLGDHNAAWTAVNTINAANDGPTGRGASDFVGSMETA